MRFPKKNSFFLPFVILSIVIVSPLSADIYYWKDENGITRFSNHTPPINAKIFIKTKPYNDSNPVKTEAQDRFAIRQDQNPTLIERNDEAIEAETDHNQVISFAYRFADAPKAELNEPEGRSDRNVTDHDIDEFAVDNRLGYHGPVTDYAGHFKGDIRIARKYYYPKRHYKKHIYRYHYNRHFGKPHYLHKKKFHHRKLHIKKHHIRKPHFDRHRIFKDKNHHFKTHRFKRRAAPSRIFKASPRLIFRGHGKR